MSGVHFDCFKVEKTQNTNFRMQNTKVPFLQTTTGQRCFSYQGAKLWNGFSKTTKNASTLKKFMKAIK